MRAPIRFYLDFASPYAWFALEAIERLARERERELEWRPILVWAILKALGAPSTMAVPTRRDYLLADIARSAAYYGVPYRPPAPFPLSSHLAARAYHAIAARDELRARAFGRQVFRAFFVDGEDISREDVVRALAARSGACGADADEAMNGPLGRTRLSAAIEAAVADGVIGSPFFLVDGERFFGADRVAQIAWRLSGRPGPGPEAFAPAPPH
jgi:2-hydroxychromene-2-carboxylate isomerase